MTSLTLRNVSLSRGGRRVLDGVGFALSRGDLVGVIGPNGAGKSTLLRLMAGLTLPVRGDVLLENRDIGDWPRRDRARRIAYLPQHPDCHWPITVAELAGLGRLPHRGFWDRPTTRDDCERATIDPCGHKVLVRARCLQRPPPSHTSLPLA